MRVASRDTAKRIATRGQLIGIPRPADLDLHVSILANMDT